MYSIVKKKQPFLTYDVVALDRGLPRQLPVYKCMALFFSFTPSLSLYSTCNMHKKAEPYHMILCSIQTESSPSQVL